MGRNTKWIEGHPDESAQEVASRALSARLERMWHYLDRADRQTQQDIEDVHQLRVFARRAAAAMEIFDAWLPPRRGRWMRKQVKRVRKAAGDARDLDVLVMRWTERSRIDPSDQTALLLDELADHRRWAQLPIGEIHEKLARKRFEHRVKKFIERVYLRGPRQPCHDRLDCLARASLGRLVGPFLEASRLESPDVQALHAFRIQSKQIRYAMEIFGGAFDESFRRDLYPLVAELQDRLGAINDHVTAHAYLCTWRDQANECATREALDGAIDNEGRDIERSRQEFLAWWTGQRRDDLRRRFAQYLQVPDAHGEAPRGIAPAG